MSKKLTKKELTLLTDCLASMRAADQDFVGSAKNLASVSAANRLAWDSLQAIEGELNGLQASMMEKYGNVNINVQTGEFVEPSEDSTDS